MTPDGMGKWVTPSNEKSFESVHPSSKSLLCAIGSISIRLHPHNCPVARVADNGCFVLETDFLHRRFDLKSIIVINPSLSRNHYARCLLPIMISYLEQKRSPLSLEPFYICNTNERNH